MNRFAETRGAILCALCILCALFACSDSPEPLGRANISFLAPEDGSLGDNSYNDAALSGVMSFSKSTGTPMKILYPSYYVDADSLYRTWLAENAAKDSCVLILSTPSYAELVRKTPPHITGRGTRILLYETSDTIDGVTTFQINRYGVSYLAGTIAHLTSAYVLAAMKGNRTVDEAVSGFIDGHKYAAVIEGHEYQNDTVYYLGDSETYFNVPVQAYNFLVDHSPRDYIVYPLLGGSNKGVVSYYVMNSWTGDLFVGMDVYQGDQSDNVPFSVVIKIDSLLSHYLQEWKGGRNWEQARSYNMDESWADVVETKDYAETFEKMSFFSLCTELYFRNPDTMRILYDKYIDIAVQKEKEFYGK